MINIKSAKYVSDYILELTFSTGEVKRFDFSSLYNEGICKKLQAGQGLFQGLHS